MSTFPSTARLRRGFTLAGARAILREPQRRALFFWWVVAWLGLMLCAVMRGYMDDIGLPVHDASTEQAVFGSLPTVWLQDEVYPLSPGAFSWAAAIVHGSWFVVPWLVGLLVSWKRPQRIGSFFMWWIALHFIVNPLFALFPLQPPWMASAEVTRIIALHLGSGIPDNNPLAAMPSLHVALPFLISLWFFRERWKLPAVAMLAYATLIAAEVTFAGEHYVVDVAGAAVVVGAIALAARIDYRRVFSRFHVNLTPVLQATAPPGSDNRLAAAGVPTGITSRPGAIFLVTGALIVVVAIKIALALFAGVAAVSDATITSDTLEPPRGLTANSGLTAITLTWTSPQDSQASGYRVLRGTTAGGPYVEIARVTPGTVTKFTDRPAGGTYFYVVQSFFETRNSLNSNEASATSGVTLRAVLPPGGRRVNQPHGGAEVDRGGAKDSSSVPVVVVTVSKGVASNQVERGE